MLAVELWLSFLYAAYNGAMVVALTEVVPASVRTTGFSLALSLATTIGGSSLAISTWPIRTTGDKAAPGYWMSFAALCGALSRPQAQQARGYGSHRTNGPSDPSYAGLDPSTKIFGRGFCKTFAALRQKSYGKSRSRTWRNW
jgi:hypothetical protein